MFLLASDLHLTDRPKDSYRFGLFKWLKKQQQQYKPEVTFILGDLTDQKDKHSSALVNCVVEELMGLEKPIDILMGNHDYIDENNPFFSFLSNIDGINFVKLPEMLENGVALLPHCKTYEEFEHACAQFARHKPDYLFIHQCMDGAIAETGARMGGFSTAPIEALKPRWGCYAGDIHRPQKVGCVAYVGSPYTIRFGDDFEPRCLLLNKGKATNLYYDCPRKFILNVRGPEDITGDKRLLKGDQVKVTIELVRSEVIDWKEHKQAVLEACKDVGLEVFGCAINVNATQKKTTKTELKAKTTEKIIEEFCDAENTPHHYRKAAKTCLTL